MATVYNINLTSHWINYSEEELERILKFALKSIDSKNEITCEVKRKSNENN
jgi:hypothetical protein